MARPISAMSLSVSLTAVELSARITPAAETRQFLTANYVWISWSSRSPPRSATLLLIPVDLLGDSLGSVVAAATAARHPTIVRRLVLIAGWADSSDSRHQLVFGTWATLQKLDSELANRFAFSLAVNPTFFTKLGWDTVQSLLREPARPHAIRRIELGLQLDIRKDLREIVSPTLIIRGAYDYLVPEYQSRVVHESIRGSEYVSVDAGHAVLTEKPDEVVELIRKFLFT